MKKQGLFWGGLGALAFGITLPATSLVVPYLDPMFIGCGRAVVAAFCAMTILLIKRPPLPSKNQWKRLTVVSLGSIVIFPVFLSWALRTVPASHGGVVSGIMPLATVLIGCLITRERPSKGFWVAAFTGSLLVAGFALRQGGGHFSLHDLALFIAMFGAAVGNAFGGKLSSELGDWQVICWALVLILPLTLLMSLINWPSNWQQLDTKAWAGFAYLCLISQFFAFFWFNKGIVLSGIARISQVQLSQPFIAIVGAAVLLGDKIASDTWIFAVLVMLTVLISRRMPVEEAPSNKTPHPRKQS